MCFLALLMILALASNANGQCDTSAAPKNGAKGNCTDSLPVNKTCNPTCNTGYTVSGRSSCYLGKLSAATCTVTKNLESCTGKLTAPAGSVIVNEGEIPESLSTGADVSAHLKAKDGFVCTGTALAYCAQNGTSAATVVEYSCADKDSCANKPCGTGGGCVDMAAPKDGYSCYCTDGYTGANTTNETASCKDIDGCANVTCGTGATCVDESAPGVGYVCKCNEGQYTGQSIRVSDPSKPRQASCTVNPECPQLVNGRNSICDCELDLSKSNKDTFSGLSYSPPKNLDKCKKRQGARTIDKLEATLTAEAQSKNRLRVCSSGTCSTADCCIAFTACPANSGAVGAGHGDPCPCHTGYRGTNGGPGGGVAPLWNQKTRSYIGTCEPIPCPNHPRWPSSIGGMQANGQGSTACSCATGYSVEKHCRVEASSACLNVQLTGQQDPKAACEGAEQNIEVSKSLQLSLLTAGIHTAIATKCKYTPRKDSVAASCKATAPCTSPTKESCEKEVDGRGSGACSWREKVNYKCVNIYVAQCEAQDSESKCLGILYKDQHGNTYENGGTTYPACSFDKDNKCKARKQCTAGTQPDGSKKICQATTIVKDSPEGLVCNYTAPIPGLCSTTASCSNTSNCKKTSGCTVKPFEPAVAQKCEPGLMRNTQAECELKSAGNKWTPAAAAKCLGGKSTPQSQSPANEDQCEKTGHTWKVGTCANCQGACSGTTTKEKCKAQAGTWTDARCSDGNTAKQQDCEFTGNQWSVGTPSSCSKKGDYWNPRNTRELCENDLTGLIWDAGSCKRMVNNETSTNDCETKKSGYTYIPKVNQADSRCTNSQGGNVAGDTKEKCEGSGTSFKWTSGSCSSSSLKSENSCTKTGNAWKPATAGFCISASNQNKKTRTRTCTSTNSSIDVCSKVDIIGDCAAANKKCTAAHTTCVFTMEATTKDECETHDLEERNHAHGREWSDGDDSKGSCKANDGQVTYSPSGVNKAKCIDQNGKLKGTWSPGLCQGDTGVAKGSCPPGKWSAQKCSDGESPDRNSCVCAGKVWTPMRCHGLVYAENKGKCIGTGDTWTPHVNDTCIDGSTSVDTKDKCVAKSRTWSTARSGCIVAGVTSKSKCENTGNTWTKDKCTNGAGEIKSSFCSTALKGKTGDSNKTACEDTGRKWTASTSSCSANCTGATLCKSQAACEKTGNTWVTPTDALSCTGKTGNTFTPEVFAKTHNCTKNTDDSQHATWNVNGGTPDECELVSSGNDYSTVTSIVFKSSQFAGVCTPKICSRPTITNGNSAGELQHTGKGIDITCDAGYEPAGTAGPTNKVDCEKAGHTWMPAKCTEYSTAQCRAQTTPKCIVTHLTCTAGANWDNNAPQCVPKSCGSVQTSHGAISGPIVYKQAGSLSVECDAGYEVVGMAGNIETRGYGRTKSFTCGKSGTWDRIPVCRALRCPSYCGHRACSEEENARAAPCNNPPCTTGSASRTPTLDNGWIHQPGVPINIGPDGNNRNPPGDRTYSPSGASGTGWAFTCNNRTKLVGAATSVCRQDGTWSIPVNSQSFPHCELITWCELPDWAGKQELTDGGARLGTKAYNIEDCWYPKSRIYARHSPAYIAKEGKKEEFQKAVKRFGSSVKTSSCKIRCFPTCLDTGKDKDGKPCVDAKGSIETTWTCQDGGEWSSAVNGKVVTHKGGRTADTSSGYPACQRAPYSAGTSAAVASSGMLTSTVLALLLGLQL